MENVTGLKRITEDMDLQFTVSGRGAFLSAVKQFCKELWSVRK